MGEDKDKKLNSIVLAPSHAIIRAGLDSLARRGLQELAIGARWTGKRIFSDPPGIVAISSLGFIATDWKNDSQETHSIAIYKPEADQRSIITTQGASKSPDEDSPQYLKGFVANVVDCFAWSYCGRYLLSKSRESGGPMRLYDGISCQLLGVVVYEDLLSTIAWSPKGSVAIAASRRGLSPLSTWIVAHPQDDLVPRMKGAGAAIAALRRGLSPLSVWIVEQGQNDLAPQMKRARLAKLGFENWLRQDQEFLGKYRGAVVVDFAGFSNPVFSPDETSLAVSTEDWLEDVSAERCGEEEEDVEDEPLGVYSIVAFDVATLRQQFRVEIPHSANSVSWANNGQVIVCCGGEVYSIEPRTAQLYELPIQADFCKCHPVQNVCAFAEQRWPYTRFGSNDRLFVVSLTDLKTIAEKPGVGGIRDLAWSVDGKALYALSGDGHFWTVIIPGV